VAAMLNGGHIGLSMMLVNGMVYANFVAYTRNIVKPFHIGNRYVIRNVCTKCEHWKTCGYRDSIFYVRE